MFNSFLQSLSIRVNGDTFVPNHAGGWSYPVSPETALQRFLILSSASGTYYVGERDLTKQNYDVIKKLIADKKGPYVVDQVVKISQGGRAPSNDPALFTLALCAASDDEETKRYALLQFPKVARTGTHLFHFVKYVRHFRGMGRSIRRAISNWYNEMPEGRLAYQLLKYQERDGYRQRDVMRLAHPKFQDETRNALAHWSVKGWPGIGEDPHPEPVLRQIWAYEKAKLLTDEKEVASLIQEYHLPREAVPPHFLKSICVWKSLLGEMPLEAMIRNLATMTRNGVLVQGNSVTKYVANRLRDQKAIENSRLHPIKILAALNTYSQGKGERSKHTWEPIPDIISALNDAFSFSFKNVQPTGKKILLAIDTSGSMHGSQVNGIPGMELHAACGAMAMVLLRSEWQEKENGLAIPGCKLIGVDTTIHELSLYQETTIDQAVRILRWIGGGGTNLSLPFQYALQRQEKYDAFIILTDSEHWQGRTQPDHLLKEYRRSINPEARIITVQLTATHITNHATDHPLNLDVVGFDTAAPEIINLFLRGEL